MIRFCLHPGYVTSKNDGDQHFITASQLAKLYELAPSEYVVAHPCRSWLVHLYSRHDGNYGRPKGHGKYGGR